MKRIFVLLIVALMLLVSNHSFAQQSCQVPQNPPVLSTVSVNPENGMTSLEWTPSPDTGIAAYIIYTYMEDQGSRGDPVDTIWNAASTTYSYFNPGFRYFNTSYVVTALRSPDCESPFSNVLTTIYANSRLDTCNKEIRITWNTYDPYPRNVIGYSILMSVNEGLLTTAGNVSPVTEQFTINDFVVDALYCFVIRADLEGGKSSTSNESCITSGLQNPPGWINADFASVSHDNEIELGFTVDPASEIDLFNLERKSGGATQFESVAQIRTETGVVTFTDRDADTREVNTYRLSAINNCNIPVTVSNHASNIVLNISSEGDDIRLEWNRYSGWLGTVSGYRIFLDTGSGFNEAAFSDPADTLFLLSLSDIIYSLTSGEACFFVAAEETGNPHGISGTSNSQVMCINPGEVITVPNLFTPDSDTRNDLFRPVLAFTPSEYRLTISNRQGKLLFTSTDFTESWDGKDNGDPLPEGVYIWIMRVTTPAGKRLTRTGTVTLLKNR